MAIGAQIATGLMLGMAMCSAGQQHGAPTAMPAGLRRAAALAEHGQTQAALTAVGTYLREHPDSVAALKLQGMVLEDASDGAGAAKSYAAALQFAPGDPELELKVGIARLVSGDAAGAIALLSRRAVALPRDYEGRYYLAQAYHRAGNDELALKTIRRASELAPGNASVTQKLGELLCSAGNSAEGQRVLERAQRQDGTLPRLWFDLAVANYDNQNLEQAIDLAKRAIVEQSGDTDAAALLGSAYVKLGRWAEAEPVLARVLAAKPGDAAMLVQMGQCQVELHENDAAVETLKRALQADPTQPQTHFLLSRAYAGLGKREEAQHEAELHQRLMQEVSFALPKAQQKQADELSAKAQALLQQGTEAGAVEIFRQQGDSMAAAYVAVGATYLALGDTDRARGSEEHALAIDAKVKGAQTYLGLIALQQGDLPRAEQAFRAELALDPNHPVALAELGEVRYRQGRWQEAIALFTRAKTGVPRYLYMLTDAYFHTGNVHAADLTAESMAAYAHGQPEAIQGLVDLLARNGQTELAQKLQNR